MNLPLQRPGDCQDITQIRQAIDAFDQEVIRLWACRFEYIKAAAICKPTQTAVRAPDRLAAMVAPRGRWARENGLNSTVVEGLYRELINCFIGEEIKHWEDRSVEPNYHADHKTINPANQRV